MKGGIKLHRNPEDHCKICQKLILQVGKSLEVVDLSKRIQPTEIKARRYKSLKRILKKQ